MISELPIQITPTAMANIKLIMTKKDVPEGYGLRIGTNNAATCGSTSFMLGFDTKKSGDDSFSFEGIEVLINKKEMLYLIGITLDYEEGKETAGFKFEKTEV
jgi:iron-sulfur cluster assembly protein